MARAPLIAAGASRLLLSHLRCLLNHAFATNQLNQVLEPLLAMTLRQQIRAVVAQAELLALLDAALRAVLERFFRREHVRWGAAVGPFVL